MINNIIDICNNTQLTSPWGLALKSCESFSCGVRNSCHSITSISLQVWKEQKDNIGCWLLNYWLSGLGSWKGNQPTCPHLSLLMGRIFQHSPYPDWLVSIKSKIRSDSVGSISTCHTKYYQQTQFNFASCLQMVGELTNPQTTSWQVDAYHIYSNKRSL